jgi:hypothetical protein
MTSTEIELRQNGHVAERDVVDGWMAVAADVIKIANLINDTDFVPAEYRGNGPAVAAAMLTGRELGIGPMMSLRHVQIVKGVPTLSAEYKRARVLAAGHDFEVQEITTQRCRVRGRRAGTSRWLETAFTMEDAKTAGLLAPSRSGKPGAWQTRPRRMLFARAGSELCDFLFADVTNGLPTAELLAAGDGEDEFAGYDEAPGQAAPTESNGQPEPAKPAARTAQRRQKPAPTQAAGAGAAPPAAGPATAQTAPAAAGLPPLPGEEEPDPTSGQAVPSESPAARTSAQPAAPASSDPDDRAATARTGLIVKHFERLGYADRDVRLAMTALLTGRETLASTRDLGADEAKAVLDTLSRCKDAERLTALLDAAEKAGTDG